MFGQIFDAILAVILGILTVILLMGKGETILRIFNGSRRVQNKKRTEKEKKQYSRVMGAFTGVLALSEAVVALYPDNQWMIMLSLVVVVADIAAVGVYAKKFS